MSGIKSILQRLIDNPGEGDCGFYSFAIGLINIVQHESRSNKDDLIERWKMMSPIIEQYHEEIMEHDLTKQELSDLDEKDKLLLEHLQHSLRILLYNTQLNKLLDDCKIAIDTELATPDRYTLLFSNSSYIKFANVYYEPELNTGFNWNHSHFVVEEIETLRAIHASMTPPTTNNQITNDLVELFLKHVYGVEDIQTIKKDATFDNMHPEISTCLAQITQKSIWANYEDLMNLAELFGIELLCTQNGEQAEYPHSDRHCIMINYIGNAHWTTIVQYLNPIIQDEEILKKTEITPETLRNLINTHYKNYQTFPKKQSFFDQNSSQHSNEDRRQADYFAEEFLKIEDVPSQLDALDKYLSDNSKGNTSPHSFRTRLLTALLNNTSEDKKLSYYDVSNKRYDKHLTIFKETYQIKEAVSNTPKT